MSILHIGTATTLATVPTASISNNDVAYIWLENYTRKMVFDSVSTKVEDIVNHPYYVRPNNYSSAGVWIEETGADQYAVWSGEQISAGVISSVNWPTTGSEIDLNNGTIKLGGATFPKFSVDAAGVLTATDAILSGSITALSGTVGGWTLATGNLHSTNIYLNSDDEKITINDTTFGNAGIQLDYNSGTPRAYIGNGSNQYFSYDGSNISWNGTNASLSTTGVLSVSDILATGGTVGGFTINSTDGIYSGATTTRVQMKPGVGIWTGATTQTNALNYLDVDGSGWLADGNISWTAVGLLSQNIKDGGSITLEAGADIILSGDDVEGDKGIIVFGTNLKMGATDTSDDMGIWTDVTASSSLAIGFEPTYSSGGTNWVSKPFQYIIVNAENKIILDSIDSADKSLGRFMSQAETTYAWTKIYSEYDVNDWAAVEVNTSNSDSYVKISSAHSSSLGEAVIFREYNMRTPDTYWIGPGSGSSGRIAFDVNTGTDFVNLLDCSVGIGTTEPSVNADLTLEGGVLCLKEVSTPTADANYGKIYTKTDNKIYFQDGAGTEHEIAFV